MILLISRPGSPFLHSENVVGPRGVSVLPSSLGFVKAPRMAIHAQLWFFFLCQRAVAAINSTTSVAPFADFDFHSGSLTIGPVFMSAPRKVHHRHRNRHNKWLTPVMLLDIDYFLPACAKSNNDTMDINACRSAAIRPALRKHRHIHSLSLVNGDKAIESATGRRHQKNLLQCRR